MNAVKKIYLFLIISVFAVGCAKEDVEEKQAAGLDTNICMVTWAGGQNRTFPGLVTYDECEALCEDDYDNLVANNGKGVCKFGGDFVWEYPYYVDQ